jgi:hypothetical protein
VHVCLSASSCRSASMYLFLYSHLSVTCMLICLCIPACFCVSYAIICKQYCTANICCPPVKAAERL